MLESHHLTAASFRQSLFLVRVTDRGSNCRLNILNCRILKLFFSKTGNVSASDGTDYCARRWLTAPLRHLLAVLKPFFFKNCTQCHRSKIYKKLMKHIANALCIILRKHKPAIKVAASIHFPFCKFSVTTTNPRNFSFVQNKPTTKVSWRCIYTKVQNISKFNSYMSDMLIQTSHTIASTCYWPHGGNVNRVLIRQANIHVRFTWTSVDDRANRTITAKHIHRWQLANSFSSSGYHIPLTVHPVLTKPNKYFCRCAFSSEYRNKTSWNRQ